MKPLVITGIFLSILFIMTSPATSFVKDGCGTGECKDCHNLTKEEAVTLLNDKSIEVMDITFSEVPGLWAVDIRQRDKTIPIYIDFSKQYILTGSILRLNNKTDVTRDRFIRLNKIDITQVPLDKAIIIGNPNAPKKIIVFDDPECSYCMKIHSEMKAVVEKNPDIAFFIKMFPLQSHPKAYEKAKTIICKNSAQLLEDSLAGKEIPPPDCDTDEIDKNIALALKIGVQSTPTLIYPDGRVIPGYKQAEMIIQLMEEDEKQGKKK